MSVTDDVFGPQKDRERTAVANPVDCMVSLPEMNDIITALEVRSIIIERIKQLGSQRAFAREAGVSAAYVNDYVQWRRSAGKALLDAVGIVKVERYQRIAG